MPAWSVYEGKIVETSNIVGHMRKTGAEKKTSDGNNKKRKGEKFLIIKHRQTKEKLIIGHVS